MRVKSNGAITVSHSKSHSRRLVHEGEKLKVGVRRDSKVKIAAAARVCERVGPNFLSSGVWW